MDRDTLGAPEVSTAHWPDEELQCMARRMRERGAGECIPWTDFFPYALCDLNGQRVRDIEVPHEPYLSRIRRFVDHAHSCIIRGKVAIHSV